MEEIDLKDVLSALWEKKLQIMLITLICVILGIAYSYFVLEPDYKASTTLVLTQSTEKSSEDSITQADVTLNSKLVSTYGEIMKTRNVLDTVVKNINNPEISIESIKENISVNSVKDTELIEITVKNANPNYSAIIANEIASVFCDKVVEIYNISNTYILDKAEPTDIAYNINHIRDIIIAAIIGLFIAIVYVLLSVLLDNRIRTEQDIEKVTGLMILTNIPVYNENTKKRRNSNEFGTNIL